MQSLADVYFSRKTSESRAAGVESAWMYLARLMVRSGKVLIVDVSFAPSADDGLTVELAPGEYQIEATVVDFGHDRRVGRLRALAIGEDEGKVGGRLGTTWTDTGRTGVCDLEVFAAAWGPDSERSYRRIAKTVEGAIPFGVAVLDERSGAVMPFVESGFGDGDYSVRELVSPSGKQRIGVRSCLSARGQSTHFDRAKPAASPD